MFRNNFPHGKKREISEKKYFRNLENRLTFSTLNFSKILKLIKFKISKKSRKAWRRNYQKVLEA
jgi:hypothetical protein